MKLLVLNLIFYGANAVASLTDVQQKIYEEEGLQETCAGAASELCGKVTRDLAITEDEFICLFEKSTRKTREFLPNYDGGECDTQIKEKLAFLKTEKKPWWKKLFSF